MKGKVLMVDDSLVILDVAKAALTREGYEVATTTQTLGASRHMKETDLVILDFHMPGFDGGEVLSMLRAAAKGTLCRFYLYSSDAEIARKADALGFDGAFLRKGDAESLVAQVDAVFRTISMDRLSAKLRARRAT